MLIGITGTDGAGKGEKVWETFARRCQLSCERANFDSDTVYSAGKAPAPVKQNTAINFSICL